MKFLKYPKIIGNKKEIEKLRANVKKWQVFEKIDGANFSVYYKPDTGEFKFARRKDFLRECESFMNYQQHFTDKWKEYFEYHISSFVKFAKYYLEKEYKEELDYITFYGEFFGGKIQRKINYGEDERWKIFDIALHTKSGAFTYVPYNLYSIYIPFTFYVPVIKEYSKLGDALDFDVENLKSMFSPTDDMAEGIVIKPDIPYWLKHKEAFLMIKKKSKKFSEKSKRLKIKVDYDKYEYLKPVLDEYLKMINDNRLHSAESKLGEFDSFEQLGNFIKEISIDIIEEIKEDENYVNLSKEEKRYIRKVITGNVANFLKKYLRT